MAKNTINELKWNYNIKKTQNEGRNEETGKNKEKNEKDDT